MDSISSGAVRCTRDCAMGDAKRACAYCIVSASVYAAPHTQYARSELRTCAIACIWCAQTNGQARFDRAPISGIPAAAAAAAAHWCTFHELARSIAATAQHQSSRRRRRRRRSLISSVAQPHDEGTRACMLRSLCILCVFLQCPWPSPPTLTITKIHTYVRAMPSTCAIVSTVNKCTLTLAQAAS